jgi:uncharacterized protein
MRYILITLAVFLAMLAPVYAQNPAEPQAQGPEMMPAPPDGMIVQYEIYVTDMEKSAKFYGDLFGWTFVPLMEDLWAFTTPGEACGDITTKGPAGEGGNLIYIYSSDIDAKLKEIVDAGGSVFMGKTRIPIGWFAIFGDPDKNLETLVCFSFEENKESEETGM